MAEYHEDHLDRAKRKAAMIMVEGLIVLGVAVVSAVGAFFGQGLLIIAAIGGAVWGTLRLVRGIRYRRDPVKLIKDLQFI